MAWPKLIDFGGVMIPVDSWAELKEAIQELGPSVVVMSEGAANRVSASQKQEGGSQLSHGDRTMLLQFVEAGSRGILTGQLAQAVGKKGKGVRPALEKWSRKIGLVTEENTSAFEAVKRFDGRGFKMIEHFRRIASSMLGLPHGSE